MSRHVAVLVLFATSRVDVPSRTDEGPERDEASEVWPPEDVLSGGQLPPEDVCNEGEHLRFSPGDLNARETGSHEAQSVRECSMGKGRPMWRRVR